MPTNINLRDISLKYDESLRGKANTKPPIVGELIEVGGSVEVEGRPQYIWYKPMGGSQPKQVLNRTVVPKNGLPVVVGISFEDDSTEEEILDLDMSMAGRLNIASAKNVPHSKEHQPGGGDMLWVDPKQILEFAVYPASGLSFSVASGYYNYGNQTIRFAGVTSVDISGSQPAATQHIAVGVYLDISTNLINTVDGTAVLIGARLTLPTWPADSMPLSIIDLDGVQTTLSFALDIISVKGTLSDSIWKRGSGGDIYYDDGAVGIGTTTIPHGGIGWAKLALEGADWDADGPHIQLTTDADDYPVMQIFGGTHEEQGIFFDSYYDGDNRSSYSGGNFQILNKSGRLRFRYDTGVAAGAAITWKEGITLRDTGRTGFGTISPSAHIESVSDTVAQLRLSYLYLTKYADLTVDTNHHLTIDPSSTGQIKLNATVTVLDEILHEGDVDTKTGFTTNQWDLTVGGINMIRADETTQDVLYLGDVSGGEDVDINFNDSQMFLRGSDGFLGVGVTSPVFAASKLDVSATPTAAAQVNSYSTTTTFAGMPFFGLFKSHNNTVGVKTTTVDTERLGDMLISGVDSNNAVRSTAGFRCSQVGAAGVGNVPSKLDLVAANNAVVMTLDENRDVIITVGFLGLSEMTAPAAGAVNTARLFSRDDGGGDTELCVRFSSGLIQVIAPLEFGEISRTGNTTLTALSISTPAQYLFFDTDGPANGAVPSHSQDHITVGKNGTYLVVVSISAESVSGSSYDVEFTVRKNNGTVLVGEAHAHRSFAGGGGDFGSISLSGLAVLSAGDTIELWMENQTSSQDLRVEDATLSIAMTGVNA